MKKLLTLTTLALFSVASAFAQFVTGPTVSSMVTNTGTWEIRPADGGGAATNIATTQALWQTVGRDGFGVFVKSYATNAALTTNVWFTLEFGVRGNAITNNNVTVVVLPRGVATNGYYTNFVGSTSATFGNVEQVRLKNVMQTNGVIGGSLAGTLFVEKFQILSR